LAWAAERHGLLPRLSASGLRPITAEAALDALGRVLESPTAQLGLAAVDWARVHELADGARPYTLLAELGTAPPGPAEDLAGRRGELARLVLSDPAAGREAVTGELLELAGGLLGVPAAEREALRPGFSRMRLSELGLDSLTTVRLRGTLLARLAADVAPDYLLGEPTAADIVAVICQQLVLQAVIADPSGSPAEEDGELMIL
jgi:hypothetical protein